jgi:uncharacterized protein
MNAFPGDHWQTWADVLGRFRWWLLGITVIISACLSVPAFRLELDESIESFYAEGDPYLQAYRESRATFGGDEFLMVAYEADDPTSNEELERIREFSDQLSDVPGVHAASTQDLARALRNPRATGLLRVALRMPSTERALLDLSRRILIGDDGRTVAVVMRLESESESAFPRAETYRRVREIARAHNPPAVVAGEPIQVHDMFRYVEEDSWTLGLASSGLLMLVMLVLFRNLRWVLLPILVIHVTLLWTRGLLYLSGLKLSMVSSMLTSLVTIICIATLMHVTVTYREFRASQSRDEAYRRTFRRLATPIFWTCLTTAIGFGALLSSSITPVRSFSIMMSLGTLLVPLVCVLLIPGGILIGTFQPDPAAPPAERRLVGGLMGLSRWAAGHPRSIVTITGLLIVAATTGLFRLTVETDFSKNFRERSPIVQALQFFESKLGGVGSWEVAFDAPAELNEEYLDRVRELTEELRELQLPDGTKLTKVVSFTDGLDLVPRVPDERRRGLLRLIPRRLSLEERQDLISELQPEMEPSLYNPLRGRMRIMLRALEQQPADVKLKLIDEVERTARRTFPEARTTGLYVLLAYLISSLLEDQIVSFGIALAGVTGSMSLAFRSIRTGLLSIIPNVLPILLVVGGMGWIGIPINIGTAMIASVSMGLTVDSTIHYITSYRRSRMAGANHLSAVQAAHGSVGLALALANVALIIGFIVLALSNFVPLIYFGVLVSVAMFGGLIGNLILLPVLLRLVPFRE